MENHHHHHHHQHAIFVQQFTFLWFFFSFVLGENSFFFMCTSRWLHAVYEMIIFLDYLLVGAEAPPIKRRWCHYSSCMGTSPAFLYLLLSVSKTDGNFFFPFIFPHRREERKKEFFISFMSTLFLLGTFPHFVWPIINIRFLFSTRRHTQ